MPTIATLRNMREFEDNRHPNEPRAVAYSPVSGEQCSATPGDYWMLGDDEAIRDLNGEPMLLVLPFSGFRDALTGEVL